MGEKWLPLGQKDIMFEALVFHKIVTALQSCEGKPADLYSLLENWQHKINTERRYM